jgi:hypothetical protein
MYQYSGGSTTINIKFQNAVLFMTSSVLYGYRTLCLTVVDPMVLWLIAQCILQKPQELSGRLLLCMFLLATLVDIQFSQLHMAHQPYLTFSAKWLIMLNVYAKYIVTCMILEHHWATRLLSSLCLPHNLLTLLASITFSVNHLLPIPYKLHI